MINALGCVTLPLLTSGRERKNRAVGVLISISFEYCVRKYCMCEEGVRGRRVEEVGLVYRDGE